MHTRCAAAASITVPWWRPQSYYDEPGRGTLERSQVYPDIRCFLTR